MIGPKRFVGYGMFATPVAEALQPLKHLCIAVTKGQFSAIAQGLTVGSAPEYSFVPPERFRY